MVNHKNYIMKPEKVNFYFQINWSCYIIFSEFLHRAKLNEADSSTVLCVFDDYLCVLMSAFFSNCANNGLKLISFPLALKTEWFPKM